MNFYGYCKCDERTDNIPMGFEIWSRDSMKTRVCFSLFHYDESLFSKVYRRDTRDSLSCLKALCP